MKVAIILITIMVLFASCSNNLENTNVNLGNNEEEKEMTKEDAQKIIEQTQNKSQISKEIWEKALDEETYEILWKKGTERPFTGELLEEKRNGTYVSAGCEVPVFHSSDKYDSGTGWPSFTKAVDEGNIILKRDWSLGIPRTEVLSKCGEHLGHVFNDGPEEHGGKRFCINSKALKFVPSNDSKQ